MTIRDAPRLRQVQTTGVLVLCVAALAAALCARAVGAAERPAAQVARAPSVAAAAPAVRQPQPFPGAVGASTRQVVSVVADGMSSRAALMRRWQRDASGAWHSVGPAVPVALGSGGLTTAPSDARAQTPVGTWAMDLVVARDPHVTRLPEHVLRPGDGWSSCLDCPDYDRLSDTGELWAGRDGWSQVAIHIAANPQRIPGRSSGVFLHVGNGRPTAACVTASLPAVLAVAAWLDPHADPRIVIAVG